jgi:Carboxypeptidase regulatory-like domain
VKPCIEIKPVQESPSADCNAAVTLNSRRDRRVFSRLLRRNCLLSIATLTALALVMSPLSAQTDRGTITGIVTDTGGSVLPDTSVTMTDLDSRTVYKGATTGTGSFSIPALPAGSYSLAVSHQGFRDYVQNGIKISVAETTRQNVTLQVGTTTQTITVMSDASLLKTENAEQSTTITRNDLNELPVPFALQGAIRDPLAFAKLTPGVEAGVVGNSIRVNGLPSSSFKIAVDGMDSTSGNLNDREDGNHPSVEMLEEFTLQSSNFAAEFGQVGGGLFNFSARSGTNSLHGSIYENFANEALNANQPFSSLTNKGVDKKIRNRQNDYGFTVGGPVRIPFLYDGRHKTFFFAGWEHYGQSNGATTTQTVVTDKMRNGDFSEILTGRVLGTDPLGRPIMENAIYDPATTRTVNGKVVRDQFACNGIPNVICPGRLDQVAVKAQNYIPHATLPGILNNFAPSVISPVTNDIPAFKIDQVITQNLKTSFYFSRMTAFSLASNDGLPLPISSQRPVTSTVDTYRVNSDYTLTANLLIHFGAGYTRFPNSDSSPTEVTSFDAVKNLGLQGGVDLGFPRFGGLNSSFGGLINGNGNGIGPTQRNLYWMDKANAIANATWTRGNHTFKGGAEYKNDMWIVKSSATVAGSYNFSSAETALPYQGTNTFGTGSSAGSIGLPYASFLLGQVDSGSLANAVVNQYHRPGWSLFAQDTWKGRRNLTIDYGMRWDFTQTSREHGYRTSGFSPNVANPNAGGLLGALAFEGFGKPGQCNCNFMPYYPYAIGPRLGVAYQADEKTVFRAGFGVTYGQAAPFDYAGSNFAVVSVGFNNLNFGSPTYGTANTTLSQGFQYDPAAITNAARDPGFGCCSAINSSPSPYFSRNGGKPPRIFNYTVSMQHQFGRDFVVEIAYVGNRASWLISGDQGNIGLLQLNALSYGRLSSFGLDPRNTNDALELNKTYAAANADFPGRFPLPYPSFSTGQKLSQALRPYPQYGTIYSEYSPDGKSWYDSLQIKLTKRLSRGLEFLNSFTRAKELDEGTDTERGRGAQINDALNRASNKFLTSSYVPYLNVTSLTYTVPPLPFQAFQDNTILREAFSGWTIGGIFKYQSGQLIRVPGSNPGSYPGLGNLLQRGTWANRVDGQSLFVKNPNCHCFNAAQPTDVVLNYKAWAEPAVGAFSNSAPYYNDYRWQRQPDEEFTIGKKFFIPVGHKEPATLQVRAEFFDIFNRALYPFATGSGGNFEVNVSNNSTTSAFGANNPQNFGRTQYRTGQLVARFQF